MAGVVVIIVIMIIGVACYVLSMLNE
ncbi:hypothetical protein MIMI-R681 [Acanthamoeba polyphaga mimivirus]|uniref:Uncharacterized protein n=1 Tax=Acanthamoeba polyphaga mimivirus TaxID=212035 RepID=E3VZM7_MIMIV|nr:hypothetical protein MIMI_gp0307 [Acanthamoeba polyphaga mimivirus]ADO18111.1 hypothetical protein [Acanthamoeba polyphaga mimivirus]UTE96768.1 hypothetical protein MIMI-R681 [Acanthamoeba polyphaga mimivirus]